MGLDIQGNRSWNVLFWNLPVLFILLADFRCGGYRTSPSTAPGDLSEKLRSLWPDGLRTNVFLCKLNWVADYFQGFDTFQSCFSLRLKKSHIMTAFWKRKMVTHTHTQPGRVLLFNLKQEGHGEGRGNTHLGLPRQLSGKESTCSAGAAGSIPGLGRSPREGNGNPL